MDKREEASELVKKKLNDALIRLLEEEPLSGITVSKLIQEAQVARASFYRNFNSMEEILQMGMNELIKRFGQNAPSPYVDYADREYMTYAFSFYRQYRKMFLTLKETGLSALILSSIDHFTFLNRPDLDQDQKRDLYFGAGAFYHYALHWLEIGTPTSPEEEADAFCCRFRKNS